MPTADDDTMTPRALLLLAACLLCGCTTVTTRPGKTVTVPWFFAP